MNLFEKIGCSLKGNYLTQGTIEEKFKLAKKMKLENLEIELKTSDVNLDLKKLFNIYNKNIIVDLPLMSYNLNNYKEIEKLLIKLLSYNVSLFVLKAYNLDLSKYSWSSEEEKREYLEVMAEGVADLASNKVVIAIENHTFAKEDGYFGQNINQISDLLVFSRKKLIEKYNFTEEEASKYIKICLDVNKIIKNSNQKELNKWFELFDKSIELVRIKDTDSYEELLTKILEKNNSYMIMLEEKRDLEEILNRYSTFLNIINIYSKNNNLETIKKDIKIEDRGYTNVVIVSMIVLTILIGILMVYVKFQ